MRVARGLRPGLAVLAAAVVGAAVLAGARGSAADVATVSAAVPMSIPTDDGGSPSPLKPIDQEHPPTPMYPSNAPAVGAGANVVITDVGTALWDRMTGVSFTRGCPVGRASLKVVHVNFWGFDGNRSRGAVVVRQAYAPRVGAAFKRLYELKFRIRRMDPMDSTWGKTIVGGVTYPGANDRKAMAKDNTSGFNCRYVTFEESSHVWSPHRCGWALDVNTWENPEEMDGRISPDRYYFAHRSGAGVFRSSDSAAVKAFTDRGFLWGGTWSQKDYQHFQISGNAC